MSRSIKNLLSPPMADDLDSNNLLLTIQYLFLSERTPLEDFNSMYLAAVLLSGFCCDAPFILFSYVVQLRRSLPGAKRRVALLYCNKPIQQIRTNR